VNSAGFGRREGSDIKTRSRTANIHRRCAIVTAAVLVAACQTVERMHSASVPTLAIEDHAFNVRRYVGRTVRVCGRVVADESEWAVQRVPGPGEFYFHGLPAVLVMPCGAAPPRLDADGCITGRIASRNGAFAAVAASRGGGR